MSGELISLQAAQDYVASKLEETMTSWFAKGQTEGRTEGRRLERARIYAILSHASVLGREAMALQLAYFTDTTVEDAISQLEATRPLTIQLEN